MYIEIVGSLYYGCVFFFFFKQKTAYEMCGRDWSSDVCSSDLTVYSAYKLDLGTTTFHNVFHVDLLRPYHANPDFHEEPPPLEDHQEYYAVERVAQHRYRKYGASNPRLELQVYWLGYDRPTWVPASHVTADVLTDYRQDQNLELPLFQRVKRQRGGKCND